MSKMEWEVFQFPAVTVNMGDTVILTWKYTLTPDGIAWTGHSENIGPQEDD